MWEKITKGVAAAAGAVAGFMGGWTPLLALLVGMMSLDYISGVIVAWRGKSPKTEGGGISSSVGFDGLAKKFFIMIVVLVATFLDRALGTDTMIFQTATICYYIANEGISVLENASLMGVGVPKRIQDALEVLKNKNDDDKTT